MQPSSIPTPQPSNPSTLTALFNGLIKHERWIMLVFLTAILIDGYFGWPI
jgi:hypothetical protein